MKKGIILLVVSVIIFAFLLWPKKPEEKDLTSITLAEVTHSVFYAPLYVSIENGYFKDEGLSLNLLLTPGADKVSAAVISNDAQIGLAGAESAIYILKEGQKYYLSFFGSYMLNFSPAYK